MSDTESWTLFWQRKEARGKYFLDISENPHKKLEISDAFMPKIPFEKREISYAKYWSDLPLVRKCG